MSGNAGADRRSGLFAALKRVLGVLLASGRTRLALLATEVEEEKLRVLTIFAGTLAALFLAGLGIVLAIVFLAVAFWEQRLFVFGSAAVATLLVGGLLLLRVWALTRRPSSLFQASLKEIDKDIEALRGGS